MDGVITVAYDSCLDDHGGPAARYGTLDRTSDWAIGALLGRPSVIELADRAMR